MDRLKRGITANRAASSGSSGVVILGRRPRPRPRPRPLGVATGGVSDGVVVSVPGAASDDGVSDGVGVGVVGGGGVSPKSESSSSFTSLARRGSFWRTAFKSYT